MRAMITLVVAVIAGTVSAQGEPEKVAVPFETAAPEAETAPGKIPAPAVSVPRSGQVTSEQSSSATSAASEAEVSEPSSRQPAFETVTVPRQSATPAPVKTPVETVTVPATTESARPAAVETVAVPSPVVEAAPAPVEAPVVKEVAPAPLEAPAVKEVAIVQSEPAPVRISSAPVSTSGFGSSTRSWTDLQTSGAAASAEPRPLPGEAATNAYERYLKSFAYPIPEKFERDSFSTEEGGN